MVFKNRPLFPCKTVVQLIPTTSFGVGIDFGASEPISAIWRLFENKRLRNEDSLASSQIDDEVVKWFCACPVRRLFVETSHGALLKLEGDVLVVEPSDIIFTVGIILAGEYADRSCWDMHLFDERINAWWSLIDKISDLVTPG